MLINVKLISILDFQFIRLIPCCVFLGPQLSLCTERIICAVGLIHSEQNKRVYLVNPNIS